MIVVNELLSFAVNDFSAKSLFVVTGHLLNKTLIGRASCTLEVEIEIRDWDRDRNTAGVWIGCISIPYLCLYLR